MPNGVTPEDIIKLKANSHEGMDFLNAPDPVKFTPAPTKRVRFADGKTIAMNRKQRRANKLYGDRLAKGK